MEQWKRICLLMQGTGLGSLVQKDSTCCRTTKPMGHSYWASTLQPVKRNCWAPRLQLLKSDRLESVLCNKRSHHSEKPQHGNEEESPLTTTREGPRSSEDPAQPNIKKKKNTGLQGQGGASIAGWRKPRGSQAASLPLSFCTWHTNPLPGSTLSVATIRGKEDGSYRADTGPGPA